MRTSLMCRPGAAALSLPGPGPRWAGCCPDPVPIPFQGLPYWLGWASRRLGMARLWLTLVTVPILSRLALLVSAGWDWSGREGITPPWWSHGPRPCRVALVLPPGPAPQHQGKAFHRVSPLMSDFINKLICFALRTNWGWRSKQHTTLASRNPFYS